MQVICVPMCVYILNAVYVLSTHVTYFNIKVHYGGVTVVGCSRYNDTVYI